MIGPEREIAKGRQLEKRPALQLSGISLQKEFELTPEGTRLITAIGKLLQKDGAMHIRAPIPIIRTTKSDVHFVVVNSPDPESQVALTLEKHYPDEAQGWIDRTHLTVHWLDRRNEKSISFTFNKDIVEGELEQNLNIGANDTIDWFDVETWDMSGGMTFLPDFPDPLRQITKEELRHFTEQLEGGKVNKDMTGKALESYKEQYDVDVVEKEPPKL